MTCCRLILPVRHGVCLNPVRLLELCWRFVCFSLQTWFWFVLSPVAPTIPLYWCLHFQQPSSLVPSPAITVFSPINNFALLILPLVCLWVQQPPTEFNCFFFYSIVSFFKLTLISLKPKPKPCVSRASVLLSRAPCSRFGGCGLR